MKTKKTKAQTVTVQELLGVDPAMSDKDLALRLYIQAHWLAERLGGHGAKPEEEVCQYVPERDCRNCAGDLPDCWLAASGSIADDMIAADAVRLVKEA